jgi:hypothetical protein
MYVEQIQYDTTVHAPHGTEIFDSRCCHGRARNEAAVDV